MDWDSVKDAPNFNSALDNYETEAKVASVYDGDSIRVIFPLNGTLYKWNCRLYGIDTPEIRTRNQKEKDLGLKIRDILREKILRKVVKLKCHELDKYGRLMIDVFYNDENINKWLIDQGYAFSYDGGKKKSWGEYLDENPSSLV